MFQSKDGHGYCTTLPMPWNVLYNNISHKASFLIRVWFLLSGVCMSSQKDLLEVLKAYTQYRPDEGYCQAQGPVAAVLLMNMPAEVLLLSWLFTWLSLFCSPRLHLSDQKPSKTVIFWYICKILNSCFHLFSNVVYSRDTNLNFQHHYSSLKCHMILQKSF